MSERQAPYITVTKKANRFDYVRQAYRVPVKRLGRITYKGKTGTITSATHYVWIRLDGERHARPYHPKTDGLVYLDGGVK